jgi:DNA-binding IscR family transcriptional regulator
MLTVKGKYSLKTLVYLASFDREVLIPGNEIALANNIPRKRLDAILGELRTAGVLYSPKGSRWWRQIGAWPLRD